MRDVFGDMRASKQILLVLLHVVLKLWVSLDQIHLH